MNKEEAKELSIEFLNRAYELIELAETHPDGCPPESRYLSHGFSLKLENYSSNNVIYLVLFRKNKDGEEDWVTRYSDVLVWLNSLNGYDVNYGLPGYMLDLYITYITGER